ncbi:MAG: hypothetical protein D6708_06830 [Candidatus Dadabacteria bacterium]|nr:MAG: hypothetical protein D6708_06830 [Candidatus Dadabacteria bacterium]
MVMRLVLGAILAFLLPFAGFAAGPFGGTVRDLAVRDGEPLWAATDRGLFRFDEGVWSRVESLGFRDLAGVLDLGGDAALVWPPVGPLLRTRDAGGTWTESAEGLRGPTGRVVDEIRCGTADPADPSRVYLGTAGQGVFESSDGGRTWTGLWEGVEEEPVAAWTVTALLPGAGERPLMAGTDGAGVYARRYGRWEPWGSGIPRTARVTVLAAEPGRPEHVVAGTRGEGLWESTDGGRTWTRVRQGAYGIVPAAAVAPGGDVLAHFRGEGLVLVRAGRAGRPVGWAEAGVNRLVAAAGGWFAGLDHDGVWRLGPGGKPDRPRNGGLAATRILSLAKTPGGALWAGDTNGVFRSADAGRTWEAADRGLPGAGVSHLVLRAGRLHAGTLGQGVFVWDSDAGRWEDRSAGMGTANTVFGLCAGTDGTLFAGTEGGVLRFSGEGPWVHADGGLPASTRWVVACSPSEPGVVWAGGRPGVFVTRDAGTTWSRVAEADVVDLAAEPARGGARLWVAEAGRVLAGEPGEDPRPAWTAPDGARVLGLSPAPDGVWVGTTRGAWHLGWGSPEPAAPETPVTRALAEASGGIWLGTDGGGVLGPGDF